MDGSMAPHLRGLSLLALLICAAREQGRLKHVRISLTRAGLLPYREMVDRKSNARKRDIWIKW
jgi:hypothetical protein